MEVLFVAAGATIVTTALMAFWNRAQCIRFEDLAEQFANSPASRVLIRPAPQPQRQE